MKKLKVYKKCDFRLIDVHVERSVCDILGPSQTGNMGNGSASDNSESGGIDSGDGVEASPFRDGIWDD